MDIKKYIRTLGVAVLALIIIIPQVHGSDKKVPDELKGLDEFISRGMDEWNIPGLAVSVVKDGKIVYEKGFGVRKLGEDALVDEHTVFGVASTTKAMTVTALGMLVDEGKIGWNDRVRDHLPWFELSDPWVSDVVTIRDLLSHRVGVGRMTGNRLVFMPNRDRRTILEHIRHQPFEIPFRSGYVYSNMMYMVAGLIIESAEGVEWDDFLPARLFGPLNMNSASVSVKYIADGDNAAWPHQEINGIIQTIPRRNFDNVGPSASVNASANDMAQWMLFNLGEPGRYKDQQIVSKSVMNEIYQPRHAFDMRDPLRNNFQAYAMGWSTGYYDHLRILQHGGATDGINSLIMLVPEIELGIFVAGNIFCNLRPAIARWVIDAMLGVEREHDWHEMYFQQNQAEKETIMERRRIIEDGRIKETTPSLSPHEYTGHYHDKLYDDLEVRIGDNGRLEICFWDDPSMVADLEHWHYDTFRASWRNPAMREKFVWFDLDQDGKVRQLNVKFTLRPLMIEAGLYPADYTRVVEYKKKEEGTTGQ